MTKRKRRAFTEQFKADAVRLVKASDRGIGQVAKELDLTETAVREWVKRGLVGSMSRSGDCWDNAVAESFFATLKAELVDHERYPTRAAAAASIGDYVERFYNPARLHSHLGYVSPMEFELKRQIAEMAA
jgi:putative transposase